MIGHFEQVRRAVAPSSAAPDVRSWLVPYGTTVEPGFRVVCFPHAGGSASYFAWLRAAVPPQGELLCVQYPGRQERRREPSIEQVPTMAATVAEVLSGGPRTPLVLFGHSLGALLAFETARALEAGGRPVAGLIASGRRAPSVRPPQGGADLSTEEIIAEMRVLGGVDPALLNDPDVLELILPVLRADHRLAESYVPEPGAAVSCPLTVLTGNSDPRVSWADAQAWSGHTSGPCAVYEAEGGHFFFESDRPAVLGLIRDSLDSLRLTGMRAVPQRSLHEEQ